jgi:localization factor PodJL
VAYETGLGVEQDITRASEWYRRAAEQGYADAEYNLGIAYASGQGVTPDLAEAASWFRRSAENGNTDAQYNLAVMYAQGRGVEIDTIEAQKWLNIAATLGDDEAADARDQIATALSPAEIEEAQARADDWFTGLNAPALPVP